MPSAISPINGSNSHSSQSNTNRPYKRNEFTVSSYPSRSVQLLERLHDEPHKVPDHVEQAQVPLNVIIIGAGLGGLATSIAMARRGHKVTVLEQAHALGEIGAGVQVPPNSTRLLHSWGLGSLIAAKASSPGAYFTRRWEDGRLIGYAQLVPLAENSFGAPHYVIHRADYHAVLHRRAVELGVRVRVNSRVVRYNDEGTAVDLASGERIEGDLLVAADGIHSLARSVVLGGVDCPPEATGFAVYRATVDTESLREDPDTAWLLDSPGMNTWIGENRHVMSYTISSGKTFNLVLAHEDHSDPSTWSSGDNISDMRAQFAGWDPTLTKLIHKVKSTAKWPLMTSPRLPTWTSPHGNLIILGDAAHAMFPYMAQGAAMAVEDGAALASSLMFARRREDVPRAVRVWERVRMERSYDMQSASVVNGRLLHLPDGPEQRARDRGMRAEVEGRPFVESTNQWSDPMTLMWAYGYDAERAVVDAWGEEKRGAL